MRYVAVSKAVSQKVNGTLVVARRERPVSTMWRCEDSLGDKRLPWN
jgi:hypothetical protein